MGSFSEESKKKLESVDWRLREICNQAIRLTDFTVVCGWRSKEDQDKAVLEKRSKLAYPKSKHNQYPSLAVDLAPYPIDWNDKRRFFLLAGIIIAIAKSMNVKIRWGGDFNRDQNYSNDNFIDLPHFEIDE